MKISPDTANLPGTPRTQALLAENARLSTKIRSSCHRLSELLQPVNRHRADPGDGGDEDEGHLQAFASPARRGKKATARPASIPQPKIAAENDDRVQARKQAAKKGPAMGPLASKNRRLPNGKPVGGTAKLVNNGINACFHRYVLLSFTFIPLWFSLNFSLYFQVFRRSSPYWRPR